MIITGRKRLIVSSVIYSAMYTAVLIKLTQYRHTQLRLAQDYAEYIVPSTVIFCVMFLVFAYLNFLIKLHKSINHLGWKRLFLVLFFVLSPVVMYVWNKIKHISGADEYFLAVTLIIAFTYMALLSIYQVTKWVIEGFDSNRK